MRMIWVGVFAFSGMVVVALVRGEWLDSLAFLSIVSYLLGVKMIVSSELSQERVFVSTLNDSAEVENVKTCHVVYQVKDVVGDREFSVQWGPGVSARLRRKVREMYGDPRFIHERIVILNITPLGSNEVVEESPDQTEPEFSLVKVRVPQAGRSCS